MLNHPWYITEEVVVIVVFDADVKENPHNSMTVKRASILRPEYFGRGKPKFQMQQMDNEPHFDAFVLEWVCPGSAEHFHKSASVWALAGVRMCCSSQHIPILTLLQPRCWSTRVQDL